MHTKPLWSASVGTDPVYSVAATPDGSKLFTCSGQNISVLSPEGQLLKVIPTPHLPISNFAVSPDGQRVVTLGLEGTVIFFDTNGAALFKYTHPAEVQCCAFSPNGRWFVSCAEGDVGIFPCTDGVNKVTKYKVKGKPRAVAFSPSSAWFAMTMESGELVMMDTQGQEWNACNLGAPAWAIAIVPVERLRGSEAEQDDEPVEISTRPKYLTDLRASGVVIQQNNFYGPGEGPDSAAHDDSSDGEPRRRTKTDIAYDASRKFIYDNHVADERILVASWDMRYRVLNPACIAHGGDIRNTRARQKQLKSIQASLTEQERQTDFVEADATLPFIPLCMEVMGNCVALSGAGGTISLIHAATGAKLLDAFQIYETDPLIYEKDLAKKADGAKRISNVLAYYGLHTIWCYSMVSLLPGNLLLGLSNGVVVNLKLEYSTVHSLYNNLYAIREGLSTVVVRNLATGASCKIETGDYVSKIAVYTGRLAVMLPNSMQIYQLTDTTEIRHGVESILRKASEGQDHIITFRRRAVVPRAFSCTLLGVCSKHFVLCNSSFISVFNFAGRRTDRWAFRQSAISYVKTIGGVAGQESLLAGCEDGKVIIVRIGSRFPIEAISHNARIVSLDMPPNRQYISVVDDTNTLSIYDYFDEQRMQAVAGKGVAGTGASEAGAGAGAAAPAPIVPFSGVAQEKALAALLADSASATPRYVFSNATSASWDLVLPGVIAVSTGRSVDICIGGTAVYTFQVQSPGSFVVCQSGCFSHVFNTAVLGLSLYGSDHSDIIEIMEIPLTPKVNYHVRNVLQGLAMEGRESGPSEEALEDSLGARNGQSNLGAYPGAASPGRSPAATVLSPTGTEDLSSSLRPVGAPKPQGPVDYAAELGLALGAAALGVPLSYWRDIAVAALLAHEPDLAREALYSVGDVRVLKALAEVRRIQDPELREKMYSALALALCGHFNEAALFFAVSGNFPLATDMLFFVRPDGIVEPKNNGAIITKIAERLIEKYRAASRLKSSAPGGAPGLAAAEITDAPLVLTTINTYAPLGQSEPVQSQAIGALANSAADARKQQASSMSRYLSFLDADQLMDGPQTPSAGAQAPPSAFYSYSSDYRIQLRRQIAEFSPGQEVRSDILGRHAHFLERSNDWQAASSSYLDANDPEKAVRVLINSNQPDSLLRLVRLFPQIGKKQEQALPDDFDLGGEAFGEVTLTAGQTRAVRQALQAVLQYFEKAGNYDAAILVAQRLGDHVALLRILVAQGLWDEVEKLAQVYPEMRESVHEARASALLKEGRFMEALERLRMAGNTEKEVAIIKTLIEVSVIECKYSTARALTAQLSRQLGKVYPTHLAIKALRSRVLVYSAYEYTRDYLLRVFHCPDPNDVLFFRIPQDLRAAQDRQLISVGTFLTGHAAQPQECTWADTDLLSSIQSDDLEDLRGDSAKKASGAANVGQYVVSSTRPQLGSLASLDLGAVSHRALPPGFSEQAIWFALAIASSGLNLGAEYAALQRLLSSRIPASLAGVVRRRLMVAQGVRKRLAPSRNRAGSARQTRNASNARIRDSTASASMSDTGSVSSMALASSHGPAGLVGNAAAPGAADACPRCGAPLPVLPPQKAFTQRDETVAQILPLCCPSACDVCKKCGIPIVRSALSLSVLPLVMLEPDGEGTIVEAIERVSSVDIDLETDLAHLNRLRVQDEFQGLQREKLMEAIRSSSVASDGRGVPLPLDTLGGVNPGMAFVISDPYTDPNLLPTLSVGGMVKRIFVSIDEDVQLQYCEGCGFFFKGEEFEEAVIVTGKCPICGKPSHC